ncbi:nuclear transport factor 2 family protein [Steroidobacter sp.]|uniref:nuclear transport factor 2 family protein n=1 Tax=Steroidobacter sp. TaxID=1978227 RepID=UPI0025F4618E|nr:nuclear transport factor 2 family protein [Steroidobacter sp.]
MNNRSPGLWLALAVALTPAAARADLKSNLLAIEKEMWLAWADKNPAPYSKYLDADYRFIAENTAPIVGKQTNIDALMNHSCVLGSLSFEDVSIREFGSSVAVLGYTAVAAIGCGGEPQKSVKLAITAVWHQHKNSWTTSNYHQSVINN